MLILVNYWNDYTHIRQNFRDSRAKNIIRDKEGHLNPPSRIMKIKTKVNKWDLVKIKSFCTVKETINKVKRQPSEWEKSTANETTDK